MLTEMKHDNRHRNSIAWLVSSAFHSNEEVIHGRRAKNLLPGGKKRLRDCLFCRKYLLGKCFPPFFSAKQSTENIFSRLLNSANLERNILMKAGKIFSMALPTHDIH
jgi:hypothetical protein